MKSINLFIKQRKKEQIDSSFLLQNKDYYIIILVSYKEVIKWLLKLATLKLKTELF